MHAFRARRSRPISFLLSAILALVCISGCGSSPAARTVSSAPSATSVLDGNRSQVPSKGLLLLAFLDPAAPTGAASRGQITTLRSMATQYGRSGLVVRIVDATGRASTDDLVNFTYDWNLNRSAVKVVAPSVGTGLVKAYNVAAVPDTLLIAPDGAIRKRWRGIIAASQDLALPLQALLPRTTPST